MKTKDEIIDGNLKICKFMQFKEGFPHYTDQYGYVQTLEGFEIPQIVKLNVHELDKDSHQFSINELKFHCDINWQKVVLNYIQDLIFKSEGKGFYPKEIIQMIIMFTSKKDIKTEEDMFDGILEFIDFIIGKYMN